MWGGLLLSEWYRMRLSLTSSNSSSPVVCDVCMVRGEGEKEEWEKGKWEKECSVG